MLGFVTWYMFLKWLPQHCAMDAGSLISVSLNLISLPAFVLYDLFRLKSLQNKPLSTLAALSISLFVFIKNCPTAWREIYVSPFCSRGSWGDHHYADGPHSATSCASFSFHCKRAGMFFIASLKC